MVALMLCACLMQRAAEVATAEPKIAYYCRLYAVSQAVELGPAKLVPEIKDLLDALLATLERDKATLTLSPEDSALCETFALSVFARADRADRAGLSTKTTALTFYAASVFMEICNQFSPLPEATYEKQRYAAYRATAIRKALQSGEEPAPPPSLAAAAEDEGDEALLRELEALPSAPRGGVAGGRRASWGKDEEEGTREDSDQSGYRKGLCPTAEDPGSVSPSLPPALPSYPSVADEESAHERVAPASPARSIPLQQPPSPSNVPSLPNVPSSPPLHGSHPLAWNPPPPRRFRPFQKVLYLPPSPPAAPQPGTVARLDDSVEGNQAGAPRYWVALADRMASVPAQELLPRLASGDAVAYHAPDGSCEEAVVAEVRDQIWPFVYVLRLASGGYVTSSAERLTLREEEGGRRGGGPGAESPGASEGGVSLGSEPTTRDVPSAPPPQPSCPAFQPSLNAVVEAQKLTKTATSALSFEDVRTAVQLLEQALALLTRA